MADSSQRGFRTTDLDMDLLSTPFDVQTNWVVIGGAQSCGKTTLIDRLTEQGFQTLPEGAWLYLDREIASGRAIDEIREDLAALQRAIADTQLNLEDGLRPTEVAFLDRGVPDCLAWCRACGLNPNDILPKCFRHRYASVFVLDPLPIQGDGLRPQDEALAAFLDEWIPRDYSALGYRVVRVPVLSLQERAEFVLERVSEQGLI